MITKLTPEQEAQLIAFREEWLQAGLCCDPADFETGDEVIRGFYKRVGKDAPAILHFSSPAMCEMAVNWVFVTLKNDGSQLRSQLRSQLVSQLRSQLDSQLHSQLDSQLVSQLDSQLRSQLDSQLRSQLYSQLDSQLDSQLHSQLYSQLYSQLDSQLDSQLHSQLHSQLRSQLYSQLDSQLVSQLDSQLDSLEPYFLNNRWGAQHWCAWEAFYLFGHEIGVKYKADDIALLLEWGRLSKSIGWWAPWDGICFVSDRPREVHFDAEQRLHSELGMACRYSDDWGVYCWHGVNIPSDWIKDPQSLTAETALRWDNIEQRRAACEIIGWDNILTELKAKTIDQDDPEVGTLVVVELPDSGPEKFLRVRCGTGRGFALPVPPEMTTALEANAWTYGYEADDFKIPEIRT